MPQTPTVVLYVRTNVDWGSMTEETFLNQESHHRAARPIPVSEKRQLLERIRLWNRTFPVTYFQYRQRLKEIAEFNWSRLTDIDLVIRHPELISLLERLDEFLVLPVDDDDWFHPQIARTLQARCGTETDALHWTSGAYDSVPRQRQFGKGWGRLRFWEAAGTFATNNYAITRRGFARCAAGERKGILVYHGMAGRIFHQPKFRRMFFEEPLSITNKSLAATTNLGVIESRSDLLRNVPDLHERTTEIPTSLVWAREYIELTEQLNRELCPSGSPGT